MNNFRPDQAPQRRADMDGGWSFDELCIVGAVALCCVGLLIILLTPVTEAWQ